MLTPGIYRTTITHTRRAPVHHSFEYRSYSWYVDIDDLPRLPRWLRPFARFHAVDHFSGNSRGSLRERLGSFFADHGLPAPEGRVTALLQARVLGHVFNPLSVFWCHDRNGRLSHVIAEVHNTYGERHIPRAKSTSPWSCVAIISPRSWPTCADNDARPPPGR